MNQSNFRSAVRSAVRRSLALACLCAVLPVAAQTSVLDQQIETLLQSISASGCEFVRNGKSYTPSESVKHITRKWEHFADEIDSIEKFVELTATRSLISGKAYEVRCEAGTQPSAEWLLSQVKPAVAAL